MKILSRNSRVLETLQTGAGMMYVGEIDPANLLGVFCSIVTVAILILHLALHLAVAERNEREISGLGELAGGPGGMPDAKPAKTQEELDDEKLREVESKIKEILALMAGGHTRERASERLEGAREKLGLNKDNNEPAFHKPSSSSKPVTVTRHTASLLELAEALELRIKLGQYASELQDSLHRYTDSKVQVLERKLKRARY